MYLAFRGQILGYVPIQIYLLDTGCKLFLLKLGTFRFENNAAK